MTRELNASSAHILRMRLLEFYWDHVHGITDEQSLSEIDAEKEFTNLYFETFGNTPWEDHPLYVEWRKEAE